jgi:AcrR family transcriptional regulator
VRVTQQMNESTALDEPGGTTTPPVGSLAWWDEHEARLRRRRPRADGLTVERIIDAALAVVDREGLDALTMRRLAAELSTSSASLYRHVTGREELLTVVVDHVIGEVRYPPRHLPGRERVERLAIGLREVLRSHPHLLAALAAAPLLGPNARRGTEHAIECLLDAGHPREVAVPAYLALVDFVLGSVYFDTGRAIPPGTDEVFRFGLTAFLDGLDGLDGLDQTRERRSH